MNRPKTLIGFAFFFGVMVFIMQAVGDSITDERYPYIRQVMKEGKISDFSPNNMSYQHLWYSMVEQIGLMEFHFGDYGMSDRIEFKGVYSSNISYSEQYTQSQGDNWFERLINLIPGVDTYHDLKWEHPNRICIRYGDNIYLYPHLDIDLPKGDLEFDLPNLRRYIFVQTFDAYSQPQEFLHEPEIKSTLMAGDRCQWIPRLDCGIMGNYDLYYVIDVAYFDQDVISAIPGINLITNKDMVDMIKDGKCKFMERYGGMIYGDEERDPPEYLTAHEIQYSNTGAIATFFDIIDDIKYGWAAFTNTGNEVVDIGFTVLFSVFTLAFTLVIYYEIKSYLPFISGGEGGE